MLGLMREREREIDLEMERKMKPEMASGMESSAKNPKVSDHRSRSQQICSRFGKCCKLHDGVCKAGSSSYFKYDRPGHMSRDCTTTTTTTTSSDLICFQCTIGPSF